MSVPAVYAQLDQGQIAGTVTDPSRDVVGSAQVTVVSIQTGRRFAAKSGLNGAYVIPNLPIGAYSVEVEAPGFRKFIREGVKVDTATRTTVDAQLFLILFLAPLFAQPAKPFLSSPRRAFTAPELKDAPDEWIARSFDWADDMFRTYPPAVPEHPARRAALIRLDDVLHIESAPQKPIVQKFFHSQVTRGLEEMEKTKLTTGARIWKIYSHSWIVRTPSVTIAFDLVPGPPRNDGFALPTALLERIVRQADVLFISHLHSDHASKTVAKIFLQQGKKVVAPEGLWKGDADFEGRLTYPQRSAETVHQIAPREGGPTIRYVAYPGHQGKAPINNNHLVITPESFTVMHTGDQSSDNNDWSDFDWIGKVGFQHRVNVLLPNCWTTDIQRMARGVNPKLILTGHENEMAHTVDHREDYTQTYNHLFGSPYPFIVMSWGEGYSVQ